MGRKKGAATYLLPVKSPCKDCPSRVLHCHSNCEAYAAYREQCDALAEQRLRNMEYNEYITDTMKRFPGKRQI